ncbi:IS3 family transposase [Carnobacterium maltaromaticum]
MIENWIEYYNHSRIQEKFDWQSPIQSRKKINLTT